MAVLVVIPTYNECENIRRLVPLIREELPDARILVVDDSSTDGTLDVLAQMKSEDPEHVFTLIRLGKLGLGAAYVAAYEHALSAWSDLDYVIQMDADLSHDPKYLQGMLTTAEDAELVVASRYVDGISIVNWPLHRLMISWAATAYARLVTGLPLTDCTSGFKCMHVEVLHKVDLSGIRSNGYVFQVEMNFRAWRKGFRLKDYPIVFHERTHGTSKLHLGIAWEAVWVILGLGLARLLGKKEQPEEARALSTDSARPED